MNLFLNLIILFNKIKKIYFYDKINDKFIEYMNEWIGQMLLMKYLIFHIKIYYL